MDRQRMTFLPENNNDKELRNALPDRELSIIDKKENTSLDRSVREICNQLNRELRDSVRKLMDDYSLTDDEFCEILNITKRELKECNFNMVSVTTVLKMLLLTNNIKFFNKFDGFDYDSFIMDKKEEKDIFKIKELFNMLDIRTYDDLVCYIQAIRDVQDKVCNVKDDVCNVK